MSSSIAEALLGDVNELYSVRSAWYKNPLYPALKRIVVTRAGWSTDDEHDLDTFLRHVLRVRGLEVQYKEAKSSD